MISSRSPSPVVRPQTGECHVDAAQALAGGSGVDCADGARVVTQGQPGDVAHQDVQAAEALDGDGDERPQVVGIGDVHARGGRLPPAASISATSRSSRSVRRAPRTTVAPSEARWRAADSPIPLLAPVMATTLLWTVMKLLD
jgi:hypothetical protein